MFIYGLRLAVDEEFLQWYAGRLDPHVWPGGRPAKCPLLWPFSEEYERGVLLSTLSIRRLERAWRKRWITETPHFTEINFSLADFSGKNKSVLHSN